MIRKRVFSKAKGEVTKSLRITKDMLDGIERLADENGESFNSYVVLILDEHLQQAAEAGVIPWPKDHKKPNKKN